MPTVRVVGGIFDRDQAYQSNFDLAPEIVLTAGLERMGWSVESRGQRWSSSLPNNVDIVHVHHLGAAALDYAFASGSMKLVYTAHHDWRLLDREHRKGGDLERIRLLATSIVACRADAIVALTESERQNWRRLFPNSADKIVFIPNGIPEGRFTVGSRRSGESLEMLFVGKLTPDKGVNDLLFALAGSGVAGKWRLTLVYSNEASEDTYVQLATELGIVDRCRFLGRLHGDELASVYAQADLFVLPSHHEALPTVLTEAMLSGLTIVASDVGGIREQVGTNGALFSAGDIEKLQILLIQFLNGEKELRPKEDVRRDASSRFGVERSLNLHHALYSDLMLQECAPMRRRTRYFIPNSAGRLIMGLAGRFLLGKGLLAR